MKDKPNCNININLTSQAVKCATKPSVINCLAKPVATVLADPCMQNHLIHNGMQDPYIQNMPKTDTNAAINYSVQMGGEHHDITGCEIM